ncbi:hypothetical protein SAMN04487846_2623 [Microbacterium sp. cf046]|uniref:DUF3226 domain-containing protein n=1 Tax=Microbacterium sp. cf046 TaxID=1761803 RepID=UPI0008F364E4|nr:DUF3226 domain-containing protein [Microbacterium sp. cf046]SFS13165.1 hypothetical protein SAMN04487846_2623 [Microbacterium sp. cf046]
MTVKQTPSILEPTIVFDRALLLLVEGPDDQAFAVQQIMRFSDGLEWHVHFMTGNSTDWVDFITLALDSDQFDDVGRAIGIVLDADTSAASVATKASSMLKRAGLSAPAKHGEIVGSGVKSGFFVMPDGTATGALEELLIGSFDEGRLALAQSYIGDVADQYEPPKNRVKGVVQAYFAGQRDHVKSIPVAVQKQTVIPREHEVFSSFQQFLKDLAA